MNKMPDHVMPPTPNPPPGYRIRSVKTLQDDCHVTEDSIVTETRYLYEYEPLHWPKRRIFGAVSLVLWGFLVGLWLGWEARNIAGIWWGKP